MYPPKNTKNGFRRFGYQPDGSYVEPDYGNMWPGDTYTYSQSHTRVWNGHEFV